MCEIATFLLHAFNWGAAKTIEIKLGGRKRCENHRILRCQIRASATFSSGLKGNE